MDWLLAAPQIHSAFSSLGSQEGDTYVVSPNALAILEEINYKLTYEDQTLRTFRRAIGFGQNVRSDLIPLLENAKDYNVLDLVIRILVNLTVPVECLFSVDVMYRTELGRHTMFELNKLLYTSKEAFTDPKSTKSVIEYMKHILESDTKLSPQKCDQINNCLLLLRNILHIPETNANFIMPSSQNNGALAVSMQNAILWNLFIQSIDKLLIYLMTCPQRTFWGVTMVQLIALMYKDQHVSTLQKMLNMWFEASLSESSEDNESNTSPPKQGSGDSSPMLTSDPTSDSSDNGGGGSGCNNESSEDRRQALREETEATLQEVSRKGHEYQNSILRVPAQKHGLSVEHGGGGIVQQEVSRNAAASGGVEAMEQVVEEDEEDDDDEQVEVKVAIEDKVKQLDAAADFERAQLKHNKLQQQQPAERYTNTVLSSQQQQMKSAGGEKFEADDYEAAASAFMPPPALPLKTTAMQAAAAASTTVAALADCNEAPPKPCKKVKHAGQLNMTKGKCCPQKRECPSSQSELSDCGYGTQVENQESISTSSNDDDGPQGKPQHQKPPCNSKPRNKQRTVLTVIDKKELRRKKLVKRSKSSLINMKGLVQHTPTDEDISNLLKEFTVDFLLKGYDYLVEELHSQLLTNVKIAIDTSHFFWLVTYFLKFAAQLELDLEHVNSILTYDVISYLTYEGVTLCEQLDLNSRQEGSDIKPYLRRLHLVVTAIREFLQAIETYKKVTHLSGEDRDRLRRLQVEISSTEDLRCLFVLLLRRFNPSLHTKQYLQDLVVTNHMLLLILDSVTKSDSSINIKMIEHISQFATLDVMHHYGILLEAFNNNGEFVNDCIFTMMHHIGGDLNQIGALFQPVILKTFSRIWEADYELCDDWSDLIEHVIHKFMNTPQKSSLKIPPTSLTELTKEHNLENTVCTWTQEEMDTLYWYYVQSKKTNDVVGKIVKLFSNNGNKQKSRISIIQQLLQQDIITLVEYDDLMKFEDAEYQRALLTTPTSSTAESGIDLKDSSSYGKPTDDIQILLDLIIKEKTDKHLIWLQKLLLECCYVKLMLKRNPLRKDHQHLEYIMEPIAYHCILKNKSIPIVQWNNDLATIMLYQPFVLLLHKLGFQLPADAGSVFARIPDFWTADMMYSLARKLGSLDKLLIKFDETLLEEFTSITRGCHHSTSARNSLSSISSLEVESFDMEDSAIASGASNCGYMGGALTPVPEIDGDLEKTMASNEIFAVPKAKHCNSIIRYTPDPAPTPSVPNWLKLVMRSKCNPAMSENHHLDFDVSASTSLTVMSSLLTASKPATYLMTTAAPHPHATLSTTMQPPTSVSTASICSTGITASNIIGQHQQHCTNNNNNNNNYTKRGDDDNSNITSTITIASATEATNNCNMSKATSNEQHQQHHHQHTITKNLSFSDDDSAMKSLDGDRNDSSSSGVFTRSCSGNMDSDYSAMVASAYENEFANSDRASVASDLTRMYVSDEDERHEIDVTNYN